jgi:hypothetical protein
MSTCVLFIQGGGEGAYVLAAPTWDDNQWNFDDLKLPRKIAEKFALIPWIFFYHCRDDEIVPFAHLALHAAQIPRAITRAISHGGHQFGNDLARIAMDIRDFMGYPVPWYSVPQESVVRLIADRHFGILACYLRTVTGSSRLTGPLAGATK